MLSLSRQTSKESKQGFYFAFHGDQQILPFLNLKVELTIIIDKPFVSTIPMIPLITEEDWKSSDIVIEPLMSVEVFGQAEKEFILNNKTVFKENTMYIYFPSNVRVDQKVNKMYLNSYESIIKELPRQVRNNFTKLIIFQKGVGQMSIQFQKFRCTDMLGTMFKQHLQKRIEHFVEDIASVIQNEINIKSLYSIFKSKYGLAYIYRKIGVNEKAQEVLDLLWQDILFNQKHFNNGGLSSGEFLLLPPFIENNYSQITKNFFSSNSFLKICSFCFLRSFELDLELMSYCEAMRTLKKFIEVSLNNIQFSHRNGLENAMLKNMWIISVIEESYEIGVRLGRIYPTFLNTQKESQYHHLAVHIARTYRSSLEVIGNMLYNFNPQTNYPRNIQFQIDFCLERLRKAEEGQKVKAEESDKAELLEHRVGQNFILIFGGFECFKIIYIKALVNFYEIMSRSSHYLRMARALKLLVLKTYLSIVIPEKLIISDSYLSTYSLPQSDIFAFIDQIMKKTQKIVVFQDDDQYMIHNSLQKKMIRYSIDKDDYIHRSREDEVLWSNLKCMQDYYKFIILLEAYRYQSKNQKNKSENSLSLSFSIISNKIPIKTDNIIHLLLNQNLMGLEKEWMFTLGLVREIFLLEKGEEGSIRENVATSVRLGILLEAAIKDEEHCSSLIIKLNNQQLMNLKSICDFSQIGLSLLITDINHQQKYVQLKILSQKTLSEGMFELQFQILEQSCLIFIIKELQIKIGLLICYYINKSIEIQEIKQLEESAEKPKKKSRKYSCFEEKLKEEEFVHMINKSEQLAMTYLHYNTFSLLSEGNDHQQMKSVEVSPDSHNRKGSVQYNRSVRSNSNMSLLYMMKDRVISNSVYKNLWTPLSIRIKPNYFSKHYSLNIFVNKIITITGDNDEINEWICIDGVWVSRVKTQVHALEFDSSEGIDIIFMIKSGGSSGNHKENKLRKQSQMNQSIFSNTSYEKGETVSIKIEVEQECYRYMIEGSISYVKSSAFEVRYYYCQDLEEYTLYNVANHTLKLKTDHQSFTIQPLEEVKLQGQQISLAVLIHGDKNKEQKEQSKDHKDEHQLYVKLNLQNYIKKELLRPAKLETFELSICHQEVYRKMDLIEIQSTVGGNISILDPGQGFEIVGKVQGCVELDQRGVMDLYLVAVQSGKLLLPRLLIDSKKGVWKDSLFVDVYE